ncbi:M56 family metallopeptidase [Enterococcus sp. AZ163]|uniref:M56 family metallopeptidase n=1 Tax=Enterococcus sp. AZ163 TaxID=2774638 RepID=UPI003D2A4EEA
MNNFMVTLVSCSVGMSLMMAMFLVLVHFCQQRYSPRFFYYLSVVLLLGFAIPFRVKLHPFWGGKTVTPSKVVSFQETIATTVQQNTVLESSRWFSVVELVFMIWLMVAVTILIYYAVQHAKFTRTLTRWIESDEQLFSELIIPTDLKIARCKCIASPMLVQLDQPTILLPNETYSLDELAMIIQHEQVHFLRKDWLLRGFMLFAVALHWFNPFIYVLARQMTKWCEISCDEQVIKNLSQAERYKYANIILRTVRRQSKQSMLSTLLSSSKREMKQRLSFIVESKKSAYSRSFLAGCLVFVICGTTAVSIPANGATNFEPDAKAKAEMKAALSEKFSNEFKAADFAGMEISYDKKGELIVSDPAAEIKNSGIFVKTKKQHTGFYSDSSCDKASLYFQVKKNSTVEVIDGSYYYKVAKVQYAGKTGYMQKKNFSFK